MDTIVDISDNIEINFEDNNYYLKLFYLIKNHKFEEFKVYLNLIIKTLNKLGKITELDLNMRDYNNEYLINYAILFNNFDIVKMLVENNARIDIIDNEEHSILYSCINYGYDDILNYLLLKNKENIGLNILDIKDRLGNIPLHYAITKKNIRLTQLLLEHNSNPNIYDNNGFNALHLAIFSRSYDLCKIILNYIGDINSKCNTGETVLHISTNLRLYDISKLLIDNNVNINIIDIVHEFTALHYICNTGQIDLFKYIIEINNYNKLNINFNIQDIFGNTALHYAISEGNFGIVYEYLKLDDINLNLWNIEGKIPLHLFLESYDEAYENILEILLEKSNLSLKDNLGNNCIFYIVNLNLWKKYKNILSRKKIDIFSSNKNNTMLIDIIKESDMNEFIDLVVLSYINKLKTNPGSWGNEWENICSREFNLEENNKIIKSKITNQKELEEKCSIITKKYILENIKNIKSNLKCTLASYPLTKNKVCIKLTEGENLSICTFTGNTLDVLLGLIYLLEKHKNTCSTLSSDFIENKNIYNFYKSIGILMNNRSEFLNFEIVWINNKLYLIDNFFEKIKLCISNNKSEFVIIPLGIEMKEGSHANYIIYSIKNKTIERFEPHGSSTPPGLNYNPELLDSILAKKFKEIDENIIYLKPMDYLPKISFQLLDIFETKNKKIGDPGGFCALWVIWYVDMRITYSYLEPKNLVNKLIKSIRTNNISVKNMIRNYAKNIIDLRDEILKFAQLDINNWINEDYDDTQLTLVIEKIKDKINIIKNKN
jgi:ankyrin repeat protein